MKILWLSKHRLSKHQKREPVLSWPSSMKWMWKARAAARSKVGAGEGYRFSADVEKDAKEAEKAFKAAKFSKKKAKKFFTEIGSKKGTAADYGQAIKALMERHFLYFAHPIMQPCPRLSFELVRCGVSVSGFGLWARHMALHAWRALWRVMHDASCMTQKNLPFK